MKYFVQDHILGDGVQYRTSANVRPTEDANTTKALGLELINELVAIKRAPRTVRYVRAVLRQALNQAMRWRYVSFNVALLVELPRLDKQDIKPFTRKEAHQLLDTLKGHRLEALYLFHDLRHSCATFLIASGVHPRTIMEILGHSQISTTLNIYGHVLQETQVAAVNGIDKLLSGD